MAEITMTERGTSSRANRASVQSASPWRPPDPPIALMTDFVVWGECEINDGCGFTVEAQRDALLNHNHRRNLVQPVLLSSNNDGSRDFVCPSGATSVPAAKCSSPQDTMDDARTARCTDFVLIGAAAKPQPDGNIRLEELSTSLLPSSGPETDEREPITLCSNHNRCMHFVTGGLCSTPFTNLDIKYTEDIAQVPRGTFFRAIRRAQEEPPSPCEHPWDPERRYAALARTLREPRGSKSTEHLANLRHSDPLIRLSGWHDWAALREGARRSWPARIHQQRLIDRGMRAHAQATASLALEQGEADLAAARKRSVKRDLHLGRLRTVDSHTRGERTSSDSVITGNFDAPVEDSAGAGSGDTSGSEGEPSPSCVITDKRYAKESYVAKGAGKEAARPRVMFPPMSLEAS